MGHIPTLCTIIMKAIQQRNTLHINVDLNVALGLEKNVVSQ